LKELHAITHETSNRTLNAKLISSLHEKPAPLSVQASTVHNSPLISSFVISPVTARSLVKDPLLRKDLRACLRCCLPAALRLQALMA